MTRASIALALGLAMSGCATTWIATQAAGKPGTWDEGIREVTVPLPGVSERLNIKLPLVIEYSGVAPSMTAEPFGFYCSTDQRAKDLVYHSAFRYGKRWKLATGIAALVEGALAAGFLLGREDKPERVVYGAFFGLDALVTAAIFFVPRKEVYRKDEKPSVMHVRSDCPEGMTLAIGDERFPVDAAGRIGEIGEAALDTWMGAPTGPIRVEVAGQVRYFEIGQGEQCTWQRDHHRDQPPMCYGGVALRSVLVSIEVPAGTLSTVAAQ